MSGILDAEMGRFLHHHLKLRMLRAIDAIDRHQSLLKASRALSVTQPALTRTLQDIESVLGGRVFDRHARGVKLTPFGEIACAAARRILSEVQRLDHNLDQFLAGEARAVSLGATAPAAAGIFPGLYELLKDRAPDIRVELTQGRTEDLLPLLREGAIEMIVGRLPPQEKGDDFVREILYHEPLSMLANSNHVIFSFKKITPTILRQFKYILPTMSRFVEEEIDSTLSEIGILDLVALRSGSFPFMRELLHTSDHLTISPHFTLAGDLKRGTIRKVPFKVPSHPRPAGILMERGYQMSHSASTVHACLTEYLRSFSA
jgi:LysR family transcriptional regulator, pca operon transcriptional activator